MVLLNSAETDVQCVVRWTALVCAGKHFVVIWKLTRVVERRKKTSVGSLFERKPFVRAKGLKKKAYCSKQPR